MKSRFEHLRNDVIAQRKQGKSLKSISSSLGVPLSTLRRWLKNVDLSYEQKQHLEQLGRTGLIAARIKASEWHQTQKKKRVADIKNSAKTFLKKSTNNLMALEIALAFLYLGEGAKTQSRTALGSSDVRIARFFVESVITLYKVSKSKIRCNLHLRADQDSDDMIEYWSRALQLPKTNFGKSSFDLRTKGRSTYATYKGVCLISCGRVDIQRRLMYIANGFCDLATDGFQKPMRG